MAPKMQPSKWKKPVEADLPKVEEDLFEMSPVRPADDTMQIIEHFEVGASTIPMNMSDPLPPVRQAPHPDSEEELADMLKQKKVLRGERSAEGQQFMDIVCGSKFLDWSLHDVVNYLNLSSLAIESEADVLCAAVRWLTADWAVRSAYVDTVMSSVRFGLMNELTLLSALYNPLTATVLAEPYSRECVFRAISCHRARHLGLTALVYRLQSRNRYRLRSTRKGFQESEKSQFVAGCFLCPTISHQPKSTSRSSSDRGLSVTSKEEAAALIKEGRRRGISDIGAVRIWAASIIQAWYRGNMERRCLDLLHLAVGIVQAVWRARRQRREFLEMKRAAIRIQAWWRGFLARKELAITQLAAIIIQTAWRRYLDRDNFLLRKEAATAIQAAWRGYIVRRDIKKRKVAACIVQCYYRGFRSRNEINLCRPSSTCAESCVGQILVAPPLALPNTDALLVIGGGNPLDITKSSTRGRALLRYDPVLHSWRLMGYLPSCRFFAPAVSVGESVIMAGGCETFKLPPFASRSVWRLDVVRGTWQILHPMLAARLFHCLVAIGQVVLAMGGKTWGQRLLGSTEALNHSQGRWRPRARLTSPRMGMGAAVHQRKVWVCGGMEKSGIIEDAIFTDVMECYDLETDSWTTVHIHLRFPRVFCCLVSVPGGLLLVGGATQEQSHLMSVAAVDFLPEDQTIWKLHTYLTNARHHAHAAYVGDRVLVVGGVFHKEELALAGVECCFPQNRGFQMATEGELPTPTTGHSCVVLRRRRFPEREDHIASQQEAPPEPKKCPRPPGGKSKHRLATPPPPQCRSSSSSSTCSRITSPVAPPAPLLAQEQKAAATALMMEHVRSLSEEWARRGWPNEELTNTSSAWDEEEEEEQDKRTIELPSSTPKPRTPPCRPLGPCSSQPANSLLQTLRTKFDLS